MRVFFFFQAEDGIRDHCVTGVQTCALPISEAAPCSWVTPPTSSIRSRARGFTARCAAQSSPPNRSEERRVGKECRSGKSRYHEDKNDEIARRIRGVFGARVTCRGSVVWTST